MEDAVNLSGATGLLSQIFSNTVIVVFLGILAVFFGLYLARLEVSYRRFQASLTGANRHLLAVFGLGSGAAIREAVNEDEQEREKIRAAVEDGEVQAAMANNNLERLWAKLGENLVWFSGDPQPRMGLTTAQYYLNPESLRTRFVPNRLERRGGLFVTVGVIGTFLGLTYGVAQAADGLASPHISEARQSLTELLAGAKLAFLTSLVGLAMALVYNYRVEYLRDNAHRHVEALQETLKAYFPAVDPAFTAAQQMASVQHQLAGFRKDSGKNQQSAIAEIQNVAAALQEVASNMGTDGGEGSEPSGGQSEAGPTDPDGHQEIRESNHARVASRAATEASPVDPEADETA
jgi:hypothetical protein